MACARHHRLNPAAEPHLSHVEGLLAQHAGPVIAASDHVTAVPDLIRAYVPQRYVTLGTDGYGRSDSRENLRRFFEMDRHHIVIAALAGGVPTKGSVALNADGSFAYTPFANATGQDSFSYRAVDGNRTSNVGTVTITITAVNDAPVAVPDAYTTGQDSVLSVDAANGVLGNVTDVDHPRTSLTASLVTGPSRGSVVLNADGSFVYTPDAGASGRKPRAS